MAIPAEDAESDVQAALAQNFLRVIEDPAERNPPGTAQVDIIAVHGLNPTNSPSHAENTWTKGDKMWLKDFLPQELPMARILLFGYNANVAFESSTAGVLEQAHNLLNRLRAKRRKDRAEDRPVIFIAHSLGGIVVKRALVTASQVERYKPIRKATYGMVFFATPHRGGEFVSLGQIASKVVRAVYRSPKNSFLESLEKDGLFANTMIEDFRTQLEDYKVISFYETRPLSGVGIIVDNKSALLGLSANRENAIALDLDHRSICKFDSQNDDYEQVSENIIELVEEAIEHARANGFSSPEPTTPASPDLGVMPLSEEEPPGLAQSLQGLGIQRTESTLDALSLTDSAHQSQPSVAPSDSTTDGERHASISTVVSSASGGSNTPKPGKYNDYSPSLGSAIKMNITDSQGRAFRLAAAEGKLDLVKHMLSEGAVINNSGVWDGFSALADAALHGQDAIVEFLLSEGAHPAFKCVSSTSKFGSKENTPLSLAAGKGQLSCMRLLFASHTYTMQELDQALRAAKHRNRTDAIKLIQEQSSGIDGR